MTIDLMTNFKSESPKMDFIWDGFLAGTVGSLGGLSAIGKSFWALQAAMAVAGHATEDEIYMSDLLGIHPSKHGRVLYIANKDPEPVLVHRIHAIGKRMSPETMQLIIKNMIIRSVMGKNFDITHVRHFEPIIKAADGFRLIVLDAPHRSDKRYMEELMDQLNFIAAKTGAAVLFLHQMTSFDATSWCAKLSDMSLSDSYRMVEHRGNNRIALENMKFFVRYDIYSQNYSSDAKPAWYRRSDDGVLLPAKLLAQ